MMKKDLRVKNNYASEAPVPDAPLKSTAADRQSVEVTVYNGNLGLVKEIRNIRVAAGEGELWFIDVPSRINPVTVRITPLSDSADFTVLEQNYEYDLISHAKLMDKYVGKKIKIVEWNEYHDRINTIEAELLCSADGEVYKIGDEIYLGHPGIKVLPELPGNLISRPTLSWLYRSKSAGERQLEVSYLTRGMNWNADYILLIPADGKAGAGLSGWVTIDNNSGAEFAGAKLKLVAGNVNYVSDKRSRDDYDINGSVKYMCASAPLLEQSEVFEYHIYDLARSTTIKNNQKKQISLMDAQGITVVKEYVTSSGDHSYYYTEHCDGSPTKQPVTVYLTFKNTKANKLGNPLPAGTIRIYSADIHGQQQFIGEDSIDHTPKNEEIRLEAGEAFDVVAERSQTDFVAKTANMYETEWLICVRNRKEEDATIGVIENIYHKWTSWQILESTHKYTKVDASTFRFDVHVGKEQEVKIKYKIRFGI